jgi:hypothetical protein
MQVHRQSFQIEHIDWGYSVARVLTPGMASGVLAGLKIVDLARKQAFKTGALRGLVFVLSHTIAISRRHRTAVGATFLWKTVNDLEGDIAQSFWVLNRPSHSKGHT